jgi:hypothetical protein
MMGEAVHLASRVLWRDACTQYQGTLEAQKMPKHTNTIVVPKGIHNPLTLSARCFRSAQSETGRERLSWSRALRGLVLR